MSENRRNTSRYSVGLLASACVFAIANYCHFHRPATCADCYFRRGLPFTIYHEGGFAGDSGFVWLGVLGDLLLIVAAGIALGWSWKKISERRSTKM